MKWIDILIIFMGISLETIQLLWILAYSSQMKSKCKAIENERNIAWEKYALKANEADNLRKRINQTYNKPIF